MDLAKIKIQIEQDLEGLHSPEVSYGCYRVRPDAEPDIYASCDAALMRTMMGENLRVTLSETERRQWIDHINSFALKDGTYEGARHCVEHRNGTVIGALGALGGKQPYPIRLYSEYTSSDGIQHWLKQLDWSRQWEQSHHFWGGMLMFSFSRHCPSGWTETLLQWLDDNLDEKTGLWRKGVQPRRPQEPLGGAAHIWPLYQHHQHPFPHSEAAIDSILKLQKADGSWMGIGNYLDLDALYGFWIMQQYAPDYKVDVIQKAVRKQGDLVESHIGQFFKTAPDMHHYMGGVGILGLLSRLDPSRFPLRPVWSDIFSEPRFYKTSQVES